MIKKKFKNRSENFIILNAIRNFLLITIDKLY